MDLSITPLQRTALLGLSGAAYALAVLGSASALRAQPAPSSLRVAAPLEVRVIAIAGSIKRDPFAPTPAPQRLAAQVAAARAGSGGAAFGPVPAGLTVPSIDGVADDPPSTAAPPLTLALKATIDGAEPVAYVEAGQTMTILRPGDSISGLRVRLIDLRGVLFTDGTRLDLPERSAPEKRSQAPTRPAKRAAPAESAAPAPATSAAAAAEPSPGPLPTPKAGSYPLGARPTSDPAAPTAFPYPYPYAPH